VTITQVSANRVVDRETGECGERKLTHKEEAESFYRDLNGRSVRVGMKRRARAVFERLLAEQNFERGWRSGGDSGQAVRKQKNDRQDADIYCITGKDRFPQIWVPSPENRDLRQLSGTGIGWCRSDTSQEQVQAIALNEETTQERIVEQAGRVQLERSRWLLEVRGDGKICWSYWTATQPEDRRLSTSDSASRGTTARGARLMTHPGLADHGTGLCPYSWGSEPL